MTSLPDRFPVDPCAPASPLATSPIVPLRQRLEQADERLRAMAAATVAESENARLRGKAEGVRLAISYMEEGSW